MRPAAGPSDGRQLGSGAALQRKLGNEKVADYMQRRLSGTLPLTECRD